MRRQEGEGLACGLAFAQKCVAVGRKAAALTLAGVASGAKVAAVEAGTVGATPVASVAEVLVIPSAASSAGGLRGRAEPAKPAVAEVAIPFRVRGRATTFAGRAARVFSGAGARLPV